MSFSRHLRRHAHRVAKAPRRAWRRAYRYREDRVPGVWVPLRTPLSEDAPYEDEDAHFWDWMLTGLVTAFAIGLIVWLVVSVA